MKIDIASAIVVGTLLATACSGHHSKTPSSAEKAIIGTNDFVVEQDRSLRQMVGKLSLSDKACTAFVSGAKEITTAAHCLGLKDEVTALRFMTASGQTTAITKIIELEPTKDRLILETAAEFESSLSMGTLQGNTLKLVGYDGTKNELFTNEGCQFEKRIAGSGAFSHSCDTIAGMSGSPILQNNKVVGIHLGYMGKIDRNAAYEVALTGDMTTDVSVIGIMNEFGHLRASRVIPSRIHLPEIPDIFLPPGGILVPGGVQIPGIPGALTPKKYDPDNDQVKQFATCQGIPGPEAATCLGMLMACAPGAAAAGVGYAVCLVASCGSAGAAHTWRCAQETGIAP